MPIAENLSKGFTPASVTPVQQPVTPNGINTANTVQQLATPSVFGGLAPLPKVAELPEQQLQATSYIFSLNDSSGNYPQMVQQGFKEGDFGLSLNGAAFRLDPLRYFLLQMAPYVTRMVTGGAINFASRNMADLDPDSQKGEHYLCLLLVFHEGRLVPAKAEFRTTKSSAAKRVNEEIEKCNTSEWIQKNDATRIAAQCTIPWGRVIGTSVPGPKKMGKKGNDYISAITTVRPATLDEMKLLFDEGNKQDFQELFATVKGEWEERKQFLDSKCK